MSRFFKLAIVALASAAVFAAACGGDDPPQQTVADSQSQQARADDQSQQARADDQPQAQAEERLSVVVSNGIIGDWTRQLAGDFADIRVLTPAGADVHTIELSVDDVRAVAGADVVIMNGATLESSWQSVVEENASRVLWLAEEIEAAGIELAPFSSAMAHDDHDDHDDHGDEEEHGHEDEDEHAHDDQDEQHEHEGEEEEGHDDHEHEQDEEDEHDHDEHGDEEEDGHDAHAGHAHGSEDPHFWFDLELASVAVRAIADELMGLLSEDAAASIRERLDDYLEEMAEADAEAAALLADLEDGERLLVTFHDAFGYFARRYGLEIAGFLIEGPEQDVGAGQVAALIEEIEHEGVARIYREPQFESSLIESIADQTGTEIDVIYSQPSGDVLTWTEMLVANARAVAGK